MSEGQSDPKAVISLGYATPGKAVFKRRRRKILAIVLSLLGAVLIGGLGIFLILPPFNHGGQQQLTRCPSNLMVIGLACQIYCNNNNGQFPDSFETLLQTTDLTADVFVCPATGDFRVIGGTKADEAAHLHDGAHCSYIYVGNGLTSSVAHPAAVVVAYEPLSNHENAGAHFLFADGHVRWLAPQAAQALITAIPATQK